MQLGGLIKKEFGRIRSDTRTLMLLFVIPLLLIVIFGLTTGGGPTKFFTAVIITKDSMPCEGSMSTNATYDATFISVVRDNCSQFGFYNAYNSTSDEEFKMHYNIGLALLRSDIIDAVIILPENFTEIIENITSGDPSIKSVNPYILYIIDGTDSQASKAIDLAIQEPIMLFRLQIGLTENLTTMIPSLEYSVPSWESQMLNFALGMMLPIIIIGTTMNLTSLSIVSEGPLPRMMLTPTAKNEIMVSKLIANVVIMVLQSTEIFVMTSFFGLYSLGSLFDLYFTMLLTGLCGVCIGLFISSLATTEQVANQMYLIFFIVLMVFSGSFYDSGSSSAMYNISKLFPLIHSSGLMVDVTLKGLPLDITAVLSLIVISAFYLFAAYFIYRFKKVEV
ncbi:MAG: ABC transporter permease [Promethearchaeota archaeon]